MATRIFLSESADGLPIPITATASVTQTIHTASTSVDQVFLWASNTTSGALLLTIEWGVDTGPIEYDIPANTTDIVVEGLRISDSDVIYAFAEASSGVSVTGHVNRLS